MRQVLIFPFYVVVYAWALIIAGVQAKPVSGADSWHPVEFFKSDPVFGLTENSKGTLFAATKFGVAVSRDHGNEWTLLGNSELVPAYSIAINGRGEMMVGAGLKGTLLSTDDGKTWSRSLYEKYHPFYASRIVSDNRDSSHWYVIRNPATLVDSGIKNEYVIHGELYETRDSGMHWKLLFTADSPLSGIAINEPNEIYLKSLGDWIDYSRDGGMSFDQIKCGFSGGTLVMPKGAQLLLGGNSLYRWDKIGNHIEPLISRRARTSLFNDSRGHVFVVLSDLENKQDRPELHLLLKNSLVNCSDRRLPLMPTNGKPGKSYTKINDVLMLSNKDILVATDEGMFLVSSHSWLE